MVKFEEISSKDNGLIKHISSLQKSSKKRNNENLFLLEGLRLCMDANQNGFASKAVIVSDFAWKKFESECVLLAEKSEKAYIIPDSLFKKISDTATPQGIMCEIKMPEYNLENIDNKGRFVALENIQDPSNLGAIARTAEAFGIDGIFITSGCDPYSSKSLRASMGALLRIPIYKIDDMFSVFAALNLKTYASVVRDGDSIKEEDFTDGSVVLIGNEANGLQNESIAKCDRKITIPMDGNAESLNASVAASILMWEMCK